MNELDGWIDIAKQCKYLPENDLKKLCDIVCDLLMEEPNIRPVSTPVTVCGDIHGQVGGGGALSVHDGPLSNHTISSFLQFYDLEELFRCGGPVPGTNYIFMGDFVDRGYYSLETLTRLMTLKVSVVVAGQAVQSGRW